MIREILPWLKNRYLKVRNHYKSLPSGARMNLTARDSINMFQSARYGRYAVFDVKTTGFDMTRDRIVAIGAVRIENGRIRLGQSFNRTVNPAIQMSEESGKAHRSGPQPALSVSSAGSVVNAFLEFAGRDILVAHCAEVGAGFLNRFMKRRYGFGLQNIVLDTMALSRNFLLPDVDLNSAWWNKTFGAGSNRRTQPRYNLDELARYLGILIRNRHSGIGDALVTGMVFQCILAQAEKRRMDRLAHLISLGGV